MELFLMVSNALIVLLVARNVYNQFKAFSQLAKSVMIHLKFKNLELKNFSDVFWPWILKMMEAKVQLSSAKLLNTLMKLNWSAKIAQQLSMIAFVVVFICRNYSVPNVQIKFLIWCLDRIIEELNVMFVMNQIVLTVTLTLLVHIAIKDIYWIQKEDVFSALMDVHYYVNLPTLHNLLLSAIVL